MKKESDREIIWRQQPKTECEVAERLREAPHLYRSYCRLNLEWK